MRPVIDAGQLTLVETAEDCVAAATGQQVATATGQRQAPSPATPGYSFPLLSQQFLSHLEVSRRCSPRTIEAYRCDYTKIRLLLAESGHSLDVRQISTGDLQVCIATLGHLAAASVQRLIHALMSLFKHLCRQGILERNPADDLAKPQSSHKLPRVFSQNDAERLMTACETEQEQVIVALLRYCGLRRSELLALDVAGIAADYSSVTVCGKGRQQRAIPLHNDLQQLLRDYIANLSTDEEQAVVRNQAGNRMSPTSFYRVFRKLLQRAALADKGLTPHSMRHHFGSELVKAGVDVATTAELMGHSNISVTSIYLHSDLATKRSAIAHLPPIGLQNTRNEQKQTTHDRELQTTT